MRKTIILSLIILLTSNISASAGWLNWLSKIGNNASDLGKAGDVTPAPMVKKLETSTTSVPNAPDGVKISECGVDCIFWYYEGATIPLKISRSIDRANKCQFWAKVTSFNAVVFSKPDKKSEPVSYYEQDREVCILQQGTGVKTKAGELHIAHDVWYKTSQGWVQKMDFEHNFGALGPLVSGKVPGANPSFGPTGRISTRVPREGTPNTGGEQPKPEVYSGGLTIGRSAMEGLGNVKDNILGKNMEFLASGRKTETNPKKNTYEDLETYFPGFKGIRGLPEADAADFVSAMQRENLNWIMDKLPAEFQDRAKYWYVGANRFSEELAIKYGLPRQSMSGVLAALSPQMDWFKNASLGERVVDAVINNRAFPWSEEMTNVAKRYPTFVATEKNSPNKRIWESIKGKSYQDLETIEQKAMWVRAYDQAHNPSTYRALTPEGDIGDIINKKDANTTANIGWGSFGDIGKAIQSIESGGDFNIISDAMGNNHKVRNFFNNIEVPFSDMGDVTIDTHAIAAGMMRPLASNDQLTLQGLGLIGLFNNKSIDLKTKVNSVWSAVDRGNLTPDQARDFIEEYSGGFSTGVIAPRTNRSIGADNTTMFNVPLVIGGAAIGVLPSEDELPPEEGGK